MNKMPRNESNQGAKRPILGKVPEIEDKTKW